MDSLIAIDQPVPDFSLPDLSGVPHRLKEARGRVVILNFWSAECPWSERTDRDLLASLKTWGDRVALWSVAANTNEPVELLAQVAADRGLPLVLLDADHQLTDLYAAQTTPHYFVLDGEGILRYRGAPDDVTFRQRTPTVAYLHQAVEAILAGRKPDPAETPAYGCAIVRYSV